MISIELKDMNIEKFAFLFVTTLIYDIVYNFVKSH